MWYPQKKKKTKKKNVDDMRIFTSSSRTSVLPKIYQLFEER
jgi:hypothetical protein